LGAFVLTALSGCSVVSPPLGVPDGSAVCQGTADTTDAIWFGVDVRNTGPGPIRLIDARLGVAEGTTLLEALAMPGVTAAGQGLGGVGTARDLARDVPEVWAARQAVGGFALPAGQRGQILFRITRQPGAEVATVATQEITYRVEGEPFPRLATSHLQLAIAADCQSIQ
jgi:hypothetical protein